MAILPINEKLLSIVGPSGLTNDVLALESHNRDWRGRYQGDAAWVVKPATTHEVMDVVRACFEAGISIVPQGGNTSQCGASVPGTGWGSIILNLSRMNRIRTIDWDNDTLTCEAGVTLATVQETARQGNRLFPVSIASEGTAEIGGVISTNAGGTAVLRYGNMRSQVLGLEVVLPDGQLWNGMRMLRKDNTGYDLKQWFIGAEGTLGIVTAAVLRLYPLPRSRATAWVAVDSPAQAVSLLSHLKSCVGDRTSGFELMSRSALQMVLTHITGTHDPLGNSSPWYVLVELEDASPDAGLDALLETALDQVLQQQLISDAVISRSESQSAALWALREQVSEAQKREGISIKHDISVPVSRIPVFVEDASQKLERAYPGIRVVCFGHVGDGNLHYNLSMPDKVKNPSFIEVTPQVNRIVHDVVHQLDGSISAEHGIGQLKVDELVRYKSPIELELMKTLKKALDPKNLMNPGKIFRPGNI